MNDLSIPDDLVVVAMWSPAGQAAKDVRPDGVDHGVEAVEAANTASVVSVSERRARRIAVWVAVLPIAFLVMTFFRPVHFAGYYVAVILATLALARLAVKRSGRTGFYRVTPDGALGDYLGRRRPDLSGLQRVRGTTIRLRKSNDR